MRILTKQDRLLTHALAPNTDGSWITPEITGGDRGFKGGKSSLNRQP